MNIAKIVGAFRRSPTLRFKSAAIVVSSSVFLVAMVFLDNEERGKLTFVLYLSYVVVAASFLGSNTVLAYWGQGAYKKQLEKGLKAAKPGMILGFALLVMGVTLNVSQFNFHVPGSSYLPVLGLLIALSSLNESLFSSKSSSLPPKPLWQHYFFFGSLLGLLALSVIFESASAHTILLAYAIASIIFLVAPWPVKKVLRSGSRGTPANLDLSRGQSWVLFIGVFSSNMRIRIAGVVLAIIYGPDFLGIFIVLWLAFETIEQIFQFFLLTKIREIRGQGIGAANQALEGLTKLTQTAGIPVLLGIGIVSLTFGALFLNLDLGELLLSCILLTVHYYFRLVLEANFTVMRASGKLTVSSTIALGEVIVLSLLIALLPFFFGYIGVALAMILTSSIALLITNFASQKLLK